jgi:hypothetical protein
VVRGTLTVADLRNGDSGACTLLAGHASPTLAPEQAENTITPSLDDVLDRIFETLSDVERDRLPACIWALIIAVNDRNSGI